jgi:TetR/AcrR family transcriptional regulator, transcriptional repressor for nem operon
MDTKDKILDSAQRLIQQRGMNGFSYADIAAEVGVRKASLHHHFATKTDLVAHLLGQYQQQLLDYLATLESKNSMQKLEGYVALYRHNHCERRACLGGMLASEVLTLNDGLQPGLARFFELQRQWLARVLEQGLASGELGFSISPLQQASVLITALQGALMVSRADPDSDVFELTVGGLLSGLHPA